MDKELLKELGFSNEYIQAIEKTEKYIPYKSISFNLQSKQITSTVGNDWRINTGVSDTNDIRL